MKQTKIISLDDEQLDEKLKEVGKLLREGGLVVFPTETVYGLGADALNEKAVKEIFKAKGRPQDNPLIVHISSMTQLEGLVEEISEKARKLAEKFWPGPLTILFKKKGIIPYETTAGLETVAVRMPDNEIALKLIEYSERPIAAPSANTSGRPSPTKAEHVLEDLFGKVDVVIDGGATGVGLESTVMDVSGEVPVILRPGGITREQILEVVPEAEYDLALKDESIKPKSPGQKYRHYSPKARLFLYAGSRESAVGAIKARQAELEAEGLRVGILTVDENMRKYESEDIVSMGSCEKPDDIARNLFDSLRAFDALDVDVILSESVEETGIGKAIFNRLYKASGGNIVYL